MSQQFLDVAGISVLEVIIGSQNEIWINAPSGCVFRAKMIGEIKLEDHRKEQKKPNTVTYECPEPHTHTFKE